MELLNIKDLVLTLACECSILCLVDGIKSYYLISCMPSNWINFPDLFCFPILMYILHHFIFFSLLVFIILFQVKVCSLSRLSTVFPGILSSSAKVLSYGYLCFSTFYYFSMMTRLRMFQFLTTFTCSTS